MPKLQAKIPTFLRNKYVLIALGGFVVFIFFWFSLPDPLFDVTYSTVLKSRNGELLGAKIADDEQWRFPVSESVPEKFEEAIIEFEDKNFPIHPGVDPTAIARAVIQNYKAGKVVSGASTLTMQVIRLSRNEERTVWEKIKEMILARRLELTYSKDEILNLYAAHAPFGGNVVGLEAASWRYFGRQPSQLSWAESATLAVLPNAPALIHPGRNRDALLQKRNRLLKRLYEKNRIDSLTFELALLEPLPEKPHDLPEKAPHALAKLFTGSQKGQMIVSSLDEVLQEKVNRIVAKHHQTFSENRIHNMAVVVLDVKQSEILAYIGNTSDPQNAHGNLVDIADSPRSTGSILKPFLYMLMLNDGEMLPGTLFPDIPSEFSGYTPKNFTRSYDGAVPAHEALARSLNVPAVYMLQEFGVPKFHHYLKEMGLTAVNKTPEHYGLSLILGGAEGRLLNISSTFASMAKMLNQYDVRDSNSKTFKLIDFGYAETEKDEIRKSFALDPAAVWLTFEAMLEVNRPEGESFWRRFKNSRKVAWKTGTSFGNRDGWAIGVTPEFVVGVWVGNADGEGRPNLTGTRTAGHVLFDVFDILSQTSWFHEPIYELEEIEVCRLSGHRAGPFCTTKKMSVPKSGLKTGICPYHRRIHTNSEETFRVNSKCAEISEMKAVNRFVLPPVMEWYYKRNNAAYQSLPPLKEGCGEAEFASMKLVYPYNSSIIYVPVELGGEIGKTVFEVAHREQNSRIYWHLDENFIGETTYIHQMPLSPEPGKHQLVLVDQDGERLEYHFEVIGK